MTVAQAEPALIVRADAAVGDRDRGVTPVPATGPIQCPIGVRVLVIDDDPRIRRQTANSLARIGFQVVTADDGAPAIAQAEVTPPDLVIVDLNMPTSGYTVVHRLKQLYGASIHITVQSGLDDDDSRARAFDLGADDFVCKPTTAADLRQRMTAAARSQQAYVEARVARERADRLLTYGAEATALLAHDLNNGLAVAVSNVSYLSTIVDDDAPLGPDERAALTSTLRALRKMSVLVANFVDIARFEDAAVNPRVAPVDVAGLLADVLDVHAASLGRGVRASITCDPALIGNFDASLIERVLHNLVGNAVRYCNVGGNLRLSARHDPGNPAAVEITIQNTGPRIPDDLVGTLFGKYSKGVNGKRGIGLYFCRLACEAHGGRIDHVAHADGPGFVLHLPGLG